MLKHKPQRSNEVIQKAESLRETYKLKILLGNSEKYLPYWILDGLYGHVFGPNQRTWFQPEQGVVSAAIRLATREEFIADYSGQDIGPFGWFKNLPGMRRHLDS